METQDLDMIYERAMDEAALGKSVWLRLTDKYGLGPKGAALLLPADTPQYHEDSVSLLPKYMKKTGMLSAVILMEKGSQIPGWMKEILEAETKICLEFLGKEEMEGLIRFYSFYEFTDRLIIGSLEVPSGRLGANMIGRKGLTKREAIGVMLYDLYNEQ